MVFTAAEPVSPLLFSLRKTAGSSTVALDYIDRRRHQRIEVVKAIFIEVVNRKNRRESENMIIRCETIDVSLSGLKIYVTQLIAQGSQLNIAVPMEDWKENLELVGDAVWVKPADKGQGYWVGLELRDSNRENMAKWFKVVHSLSRRPPG
jgi:hypothetical protein